MENMSDDEQTENYEVGYGKPPISGQFKKGVSGNPSGRPKKPSDFRSKVLRELDLPLIINEDGKRKVITKDEAIAKQAVNKAVGGHVQYMRLVDAWRQQALEKAAEEDQRALDKANWTVKELTDEELTALIRADPKASALLDKMRLDRIEPLSSTDPDI